MNNLISFIAPVYNFYPIMADSVLLQTHNNVEVIIVHDGPPDLKMKEIIDSKLKDPRVKYVETDRRYNDLGHTPRALGLEHVSTNSDFVVISGGDNYYVPGYCEELLKVITPEHIGAFCNCVHDKFHWITIDVELVCSRIDGGCMMTRTEAAKKIGWFSREYVADWYYIERLRDTYGEDRFIKIDKTLFIHN